MADPELFGGRLEEEVSSMFPSSPPGFLPSVRPSSLVRPRVSRVKQVLTMAGLGFPDPRSPPRSPGRSEQIPLSYSGSAVERHLRPTPTFCWRVFQCRVLARQGAATPVSSDTPPRSGKASDARPLFARRTFAAGGRLGECGPRLQFQVAPLATRPKSDLGHNVSQ